MEDKLRALWSEARELNLGTTDQVDRLPSPPTPLQFLLSYVSPNKPCVVSSSSTSHWPAISRWSSRSYFLRPSLRRLPVSLHLTPSGRADALAPHPSNPSSLCFASAAAVSVPFADALRLIEGDHGSDAVVAYAQQQNDSLRSEYSPLLDDVEAHIPWATEAFGGAQPDAVNLWIGNSRSQTSFHRDHYENIYVVVTGEKHFLLLPPTEVHRLYIQQYPAAVYKGGAEGLRLELEEPQREVPWCSVEPYPETEEEMARQRREFPMYFDGPEPFKCTVRAGEMLYLPSMWFHHVRQSPDENGRCIAVNYWYDMQFDIKYAYFNFLQSIDYRAAAIGEKDVGDESKAETSS